MSAKSGQDIGQIEAVNRTAAEAVRIGSANRMGQRSAGEIAGEGVPLFVIGDTDQHEFTGADLDTLQPDIEAMLVKASAGRSVDIVIQAAEISEPEFANTDIDILHTRSVPGHIQVEVILRVNVEPIIEPLTTPEGDFGSALEHVSHFQVRFAH